MPRTSRARAFRHRFIYQALVTASRAGRSMSLKNARRTGRGIGRLAYRVLGRERAKALENLQRAFPSQSQEDRTLIARRMFEHLGTSLLEICWLPNLSREVLEQTTRIEGLEHFQEAAQSGRGIVLFTGHCGNWEWLAASMSLLGFDINVVAREVGNERVNDFIVEARKRHGVKTIGRGSMNAGRELLRALRSGGVLGVLIDQSIRAENVEADFFGSPAPTPVGPAKMAIRAGSIAMAGFIERDVNGLQRIRFEPGIATTRDDDPVELTQRMTSAIERQIRRVPEQWVWMHQRWRKR